jgi:hypothetical protein
VILSSERIDYTAITSPSVILVLADEGVTRREEIFAQVDEKTLIIQAAGVGIPETGATVKMVDFDSLGIKAKDRSMAALAVMAGMKKVIDPAMLHAALGHRFQGKLGETVSQLVDHVIITIGERDQGTSDLE